jgi:heme O synthase-like polyprenyltransferase
LLLIPTGAVGAFYTSVAVALGLGALIGSVWLRGNPEHAIRYFVASNLYLATLFAAMAIDGLL